MLIDELFIETWKNSSNYSEYYLFCAPLECRYTYATKTNGLYILTTFLGLYGGLSVGLKLVVWYGLDIYLKIYQLIIHRRTQIQAM